MQRLAVRPSKALLERFSDPSVRRHGRGYARRLRCKDHVRISDRRWEIRLEMGPRKEQETMMSTFSICC